MPDRSVLYTHICKRGDGGAGPNDKLSGEIHVHVSQATFTQRRFHLKMEAFLCICTFLLHSNGENAPRIIFYFEDAAESGKF